MTLPNHLMVSESDGHLYDTRKPEWHLKEPLRKNYCRPATHISTGAELRAAMRDFYSSNYPEAFICADGGLLSYEAVKDNLRLVLEAIRDGYDNQWRVVGMTVLHSGEEVEYCSHTGEPING